MNAGEKIAYESEIPDAIHAKANTAKNECFFVGFLDGVIANGRIDDTELEPLLAECDAICRLVGDHDAAEIIAEASAGHHDTPAALLDLLAQVAEVRSTNIDGECRRSSANRLLGFCAGINCDGVVTTTEAHVLLERLIADHDLRDDPRIATLEHAVRDVLGDDHVDKEESRVLGDLIAALVGDSYSDTGIPSSEAVPVMQDLDLIDETVLSGRSIVLTGAFAYGTRREVGARIVELGGLVQSSPTAMTDIVIVGSEGSAHWTHRTHGGKLAKALALRSKKTAPRIYVEGQLRALLS